MHNHYISSTPNTKMGFLGKLFDIILLIILIPIVILKFILAWITKKPAYGPKKDSNEIEAEFTVEDEKPAKPSKLKGS